MPWQTPKTDWIGSDAPTPGALNRIEGNILELKKAATIDIVDAGSNFQATNVEDALQELAGNVVAGKSAIASAIYSMGQQASGDMTFAELAAKIRDISDDATAAVGDVLAGKTFYQGGSKKTGTMVNRGAVTLTPGTSDQSIAAGYHNGSGKVVGDPDLVAANIKKGVQIFGALGTYTSDATAAAAEILASKTAYVNGAKVTGTMANNGTTTITPGTSDQALSGYYAPGSKVVGDPDLIPENIIKGKNIFGVGGASPTHKYLKYSMMRFLGSVSLSTTVNDHRFMGLDNTGTYCVVGERRSSDNALILILFKRTGEAWAEVHRYTVTGVDAAAIHTGAYFTPSNSHFLVQCGYMSYLFKISSNTIVQTSTVACGGYEINGIATTWDSTGTYFVVQRTTNATFYLVKRTGDALAVVSTVSFVSHSVRGFITASDNMSTIVTGSFTSSHDGIALLEKIGETLNVVTESAASSYVRNTYVSHDGVYVVDGTTVRKRVGSSLTTVTNFSLISSNRYVPWTSPPDVDLILATSTGNEVFEARGLDGDKVRFVISFVGGNPTPWGSPSASSGQIAAYSANGEYLALSILSGSNASIYFYKVGELP